MTAFPTRSNRLIEYHEFGPAPGGGQRLERTVRYVYYKTGHAANILVKDEWLGTGTAPAAYDFWHSLSLSYTSTGMLWHVMTEKWKEAASPPGSFSDYTRERLQEFLYESPRGRMLSRELATTGPDYTPLTTSPEKWTEYLGDEPYGEFDISFAPPATAENPTLTEKTRYLLGSGVQAQQTVGASEPGATRYFHADLIRSTMLQTDGGGNVATTTLGGGSGGGGGSALSKMAYTAFGEPVAYDSGSSSWRVGFDPQTLATHYGYAGGWDYESGLVSLTGANAALPPITLQHLGWRWYDASIGRFVQRDPIGVNGGINVYGYPMPLNGVDPSGELTIHGGISGGFGGGFPGVGGTGEIGLVADGVGIRLYWELGTGIAWGAGASIGGTLGATTAATSDALAGWAGQASISTPSAGGSLIRDYSPSRCW